MIVGTVVKITSTTSIAADSVTISIWDTDNTLKVDEASMTGSSTTWTYIYQSSLTDDYGVYKVRVSAVSGAYTARSNSGFELTEA